MHQLSIRPLAKGLQRKAKDELYEIPERVYDDVQHVKKWLRKHPYINVKATDQWILNFLRGCKFSLQKTKDKLTMYYGMRSVLPEFFDNRDPFRPEIQEFLNKGICLPLQKSSDPTAPRVMLYRIGPCNPEVITFQSGMKATQMILDLLMLEDDNSVIMGQHHIYDLQDLSYKYIAELTPHLLKKMITYIQYAHPVRAKGFHFINVPHVFEPVYNLMSRFAKDHIRRKVNVYTRSSFDTIYETIPISIMPKEYGGGGESVNKLAADLKEKVESYRDWYLEDAVCLSEELKYFGQPTVEDDLGIEGSFRKLEFD